MKTQTLTKDLSWLPPYTIRISTRARYLRLSICRKQGLIVTLPKRLSKKQIISFLNEQETWLLKHKAILLHSSKPIDLPETLGLTAIDELYQIHYALEPMFKRTRLYTANNEITIICPEKNADLAQAALCQFIRYTAEQHLLPWLERLSQTCQLPFKSASIRSQQQRWGSCSSDKRISLNDKLLFLPTQLVDHVIIHELCHTIHLNHSATFWKLVKRFDKQCDELKIQLKKSDRYIPRWL